MDGWMDEKDRGWMNGMRMDVLGIRRLTR